MSIKPDMRNSNIDLLKFLFSIVVVLLHFGSSHGTQIIPGGHLVVEGFFMISGYFMMQSVCKASGNRIGRDTLQFVKHKYSSFALPLLFSALMGFAISFVAFPSDSIKTSLLRFVALSTEIIPLQVSGIHTTAATGVAWYLSAMMLSLLILYPLARRLEDKFTRIVCPLLVIFIYACICSNFGRIDVIMDLLPGTPIHVGLLRGIAGISAGCMLYDCVKATAEYKASAFGEVCFSLAEIACALIFTAIMLFMGNTAMDFFALPFVFILLYCAFGRKSLVSKRFSFEASKYLSTASLVIYLNHHYWNFLITAKMSALSAGKKFGIYIALIIASCVVVQLASFITKLIWKKLKPFAKAHFVGQ